MVVLCCQARTKPHELLSAVTLSVPRLALTPKIAAASPERSNSCRLAFGAIPFAVALTPFAIIVPATCVA